MGSSEINRVWLNPLPEIQIRLSQLEATSCIQRPRAHAEANPPQPPCLSLAKQTGVFTDKAEVNCRLKGLIKSPTTLNYRAK